MTEYTRISYAPSAKHIHVWEVLPDGSKNHLFACNEICDNGHCIGPDEFSSECEVSVRDVVVERVGETVTVNLVDSASEPPENM